MISRPLILIHASLTLLIPLFLALFITGCDASLFGDKNKGQSVDYGPETSQDEIKNALMDVFAEYDPATLKVDEWAQQDVTQEISGQEFLTEDIAQTVTAREDDDPVETVFRVVENRRWFDRDLKVTKKVDTEFSIKINKNRSESAAQSELAAAAEGYFGDPLYRINNEMSQASTRETTLTFHNLTKSVSTEAPPPAVSGSPNCSSIYPNCQIRVYTIAYDLVYWTDGKGEKLHREYKISPDVPYLGAILSECVSGLVHITGEQPQSVYVKECTKSKNFKYGN